MTFRFFAATLLILLLISGNALADLVIDSKTEIEVIGMGKMTIEGSQSFRGDKSYTKMLNSGMMGMSQESVEIVRLDKGVQWVLFPDQEKYAEISFATVKEMSAAMDTAEAQSGGYTWTTTFEELDETEMIAGAKCRAVHGRALGIKTDDPSDTAIIEFKQYIADDFKGAGELEAFRESYMESTGLNDQLFSQLKGNPMMAQYGQPMQELSEKMKAQKGTPLKTRFSIETSKNPMGTSMGNTQGISVLMSIENTITAIEQKAVADTLFQIPEGYEKTDISQMMGP